jgi:hypothetical protein
MRPNSPFVIDDPEKWNEILWRYKIKKTTWTKMALEYKHWCPEFNPSILKYVDDVEFCQQCSTFFHFAKTTIRGCKSEFLAWLKEYWQTFHGETFMEIVEKCCLTLQQFNLENEDAQIPFINWIPLYGGLLREPQNFPNDDELQFHSKLKIPFPLEPQIPQTDEEEEQLFVLPDDPASGL